MQRRMLERWTRRSAAPPKQLLAGKTTSSGRRPSLLSTPWFLRRAAALAIAGGLILAAAYLPEKLGWLERKRRIDTVTEQSRHLLDLPDESIKRKKTFMQENLADDLGTINYPYGETPVPLLVYLADRDVTYFHERALFDTAARRRFAILTPRRVGDSRRDPRVWTRDRLLRSIEAAQNLRGVHIDFEKVILVGRGRNATAAAIAANREPVFKAFAILHGHFSSSSLEGDNEVPGWISTAEHDPHYPGAVVRRIADEQEPGSRIVCHIFEGTDVLTTTETDALAEWWMAED